MLSRDIVISLAYRNNRNTACFPSVPGSPGPRPHGTASRDPPSCSSSGDTSHGSPNGEVWHDYTLKTTGAATWALPSSATCPPPPRQPASSNAPPPPARLGPLQQADWDDVEANRKDVSSCLARQDGTATLSWSNLTVTVKDAKGNARQILKGVDGWVPPWWVDKSTTRAGITVFYPLSPLSTPPAPMLRGSPAICFSYVEPNHMCAIMGPSGCGKTTLLDTLAGRLASNAQQGGDIRVNGHATQLSYGKSAYVTQDDVLIGTLTVFETIFFSAKLRLPQVGGQAGMLTGSSWGSIRPLSPSPARRRHACTHKAASHAVPHPPRPSYHNACRACPTPRRSRSWTT